MMITLQDFLRLQNRVQRCVEALEIKAGRGFEQTHILTDSSTHTYRISGIKSPEQLEDELLNLFCWIWNMKDYLKTLCIAQGTDAQQIENIVNAEFSLGVAADISNRAKHGNLNKSRTGKFARLVNVGYDIPAAALGSLSVGAFDVHLDIKQPELTQLHASVEFDGGEPSQDAFELARQAINAWERWAFPVAGVVSLPAASV